LAAKRARAESLEEATRREEERREAKRREERRASRPIRAPRQGDLCLIRRSRLAEAARTGIHIRHGQGSNFTLILVVFLARIQPQLHGRRSAQCRVSPRIALGRARGGGPLPVLLFLAFIESLFLTRSVDEDCADRVVQGMQRLESHLAFLFVRKREGK